MALSDSSGVASTEISTVNIKLPEFWSSDSELWFLMIEATFRRHKITSQHSKFDHVVSSLPPSAAFLIRDIIRAPPDEGSYDTLRETLISRTTESEERRLRQLLTSEELGDRKPTELLRCMLQLLGDKQNSIDGVILRELFLQRLPTQVRMILSTSTSESLETLARMADQIIDVSSPGILQIRQEPQWVNPVLTPPLSDDRLMELLEANRALTAKVEQLSKNVADLRLDRRRSTTRSRQVFYGRRSRSRSQSPRTGEMCWYHRKFGDNAQNCQPPCSQQGNDRATR